MGNRAVIAFGKAPTSIGIYLHWNGGESSVRAFLDGTKALMKSRGADKQYGPARLVQAIGNFMGGCLSLGIGPRSSLDCDNGDNGTFIVDPEKLEIIERQFSGHSEPFDQKYYDGVLESVIEVNTPIFNRKE